MRRSVSIVAALSLLLASCGGGTADTTSPQPPNQNPPPSGSNPVFQTPALVNLTVPDIQRIIAQGVAANMVAEQQSATLDGGGIVDYCRLHDITVQAWSPFQAGFFTGVFLGSPDHPELNAVIDRLAAEYDVPPLAIATAWITRHPAGMQVVLGTTSPERVAGAAQGSELPLTRAEWYELFRTGGHLIP